jgi:UDP-N-acetylglucosamine 4,6-dehydratase
MTRFSLELEHGVEFVLDNLERMHGGEIFIPKIPSYRILDVAEAIAPEAEKKFIGIRPGEKLHELMISEDDARNSLEFEDYFIIQPTFPWWRAKEDLLAAGGRPCPDGFSYRSDTNTDFLTVPQLRKVANNFLEKHPEYK